MFTLNTRLRGDGSMSSVARRLWRSRSKHVFEARHGSWVVFEQQSQFATHPTIAHISCACNTKVVLCALICAEALAKVERHSTFNNCGICWCIGVQYFWCDICFTHLVDHLLSSLPLDAWLIFANVDELFDYPCDVVQKLDKIRRGYAAKLRSDREIQVESKQYGMQFAVCAHMTDRFSLESSREVKAVRMAGGVPIEEQFPHCGRVRGQVRSA